MSRDPNEEIVYTIVDRECDNDEYLGTVVRFPLSLALRNALSSRSERDIESVAAIIRGSHASSVPLVFEHEISPCGYAGPVELRESNFGPIWWVCPECGMEHMERG